MTIKYKIFMLFVLATILVLATKINDFSAYGENEKITLSPYKQYQQGIPINQIQCHDSKILLETVKNTPVCVNEGSIEKLLDRGFVKVSVKVDVVNFESPSEKYSYSAGHTDLISPLTTNHLQKPILNPIDIEDLIPKGFKLEYAFKTSTDHSNDFIQKITTLYDDKIIKKIILPNGIRYDTQRGSIQIFDSYAYDFPIKYTFFGKDRIHPDKAEETTLNLLNELGIVLDGTEMFQYEPAQTASYTYWIAQQKDGFIIKTNQIKTTFDAGNTFFHIGNWNVDISEFEMYDFGKSKENAIEYLSSIDKIAGKDCNVKYKKGLEDRYDSVLILNGYPVYQIYSGTCQVEIWDGHYISYHTIIDALSGEPLFAKNMVLF